MLDARITSLEDDQVEANSIINAVAVNLPMSPFFIERMRKIEGGPQNAWWSDPSPRNFRAPAWNIIRTGLQWIAGPARTLGNKPTKVEVWRIFYDPDIILQIVTNSH